MKLFQWTWLAAALITLAAACAPVTIQHMSQLTTITAAVTSASPFAVKAAPVTLGAVGSYKFELYNVGMSTVTASYTTVASVCKFASVPDGTYQLRAEAFNGSSQSITTGGPQMSANNATVASPIVTYSSGSSLAVVLNLFAGTGETTAQTLTVNPGQPYAGAASVAGAVPLTAGTVLRTVDFTGGNNPKYVAFDKGGTAWVLLNGTVKRVSTTGAILSSTPVTNPGGITFTPDGSAWIPNQGGSTVVKLDVNGNLVNTYSVAGAPNGIAADRNGDVWVSLFSNAVQKLSGTTGSSLAQYSVGTQPYGIAINDANEVWVTDNAANSLIKLTPNGSVAQTFPVPTGPVGVAIDSVGGVWVASQSGGSVSHFLPNNTQAVGSPYSLTGATQITFDFAANVWVTANGGSVKKLSPSGSVLNSFGGFSSPYGIACDPIGNLWVANSSSTTVQILSP